MPKNSSPPGQDFYKRMQRVLGSTQECHQFFESLAELSRTRRGRVLRWNHRSTDSDARALLGTTVGPPVPWCPGADFWLPDLGTSAGDPSVADSLKLLQGVGALWIQEGAATEVVAALPDLSDGARVLDLCAAPGSKSSHLWDRFGARVEIWCHDAVPSRALRLNALLARWGAQVSRVSCGPVEGLAEERFDLIVLDAPCTGETLFAKRVDQRHDVSDRQVREASLLQRHLAHLACAMVKPGGFLMYSTCAYNREENEDLVEKLMDQRSTEGESWSLIRSQRRWPHRDGVPGGAWFLLRKDSDGPGQKKLPEPFRKKGKLQILSRSMSPSLESPVGERGTDLESDLGTDLEVVRLREAHRAWARQGVERDDALKLLRGESIPNVLNLRGDVLICWDGGPLVPVHAVSDRLNNRLPKRLREL